MWDLGQQQQQQQHKQCLAHPEHSCLEQSISTSKIGWGASFVSRVTWNCKLTWTIEWQQQLHLYGKQNTCVWLCVCEIDGQNTSQKKKKILSEFCRSCMKHVISIASFTMMAQNSRKQLSHPELKDWFLSYLILSYPSSSSLSFM